jgi:hypothetical protein
MTTLIFIPRTRGDANQFNEMIEASDFYAEWNMVEGYFSFEEADSTLDMLEADLQELIDNNPEEINGRFEAE